MSEDLPTDDYPPLSALNDLLYCERRCALHRIENVWVDNAHTTAGTLAHKRADRPVTWQSAAGVREVHGMWLKSDRLRLIGKGDVVEFHALSENSEVPYPIEYKRGKRRKWENDDVQLCAQALCLEEMLNVEVPRGAVYHVKTRRRREVHFTDTLRRKTENAASRLHELIAASFTPPPVLKPQCQGCSLRELCLPVVLGQTEQVATYVRSLFQIVPESLIVN